MDQIRDLIDMNCPMIFAGNWPTENGRGWRWVMNLPYENMVHAREVIHNYQERHGILNVTIGQPFDHRKLKPVPVITKFGLYVRDIEDILSEYLEMLNTWQRTGSWK